MAKIENVSVQYQLPKLKVFLGILVVLCSLGFPQSTLAQSLGSFEQQISLLNGEYLTENQTASPTDNSFGLISFDSSQYSGDTVYFEALIRCDSCTGGSSSVVASLYNDAGVSQTTVSTTQSSYTLVRSGSLILPADDYTVRFHRDGTGGTAYIKSARLVIVQSGTGNSLTDTQTHIEVGSSTSTVSESATEMAAPKIYRFDADQYSGAVTAYFEATLRTENNSTTATYYADEYDAFGEEWSTNQSNMVDGNTASYASTNNDGDIQLLTSNTAASTDLGPIATVEARIFGYQTNGSDGVVNLRPVFSGGDGDNHPFSPPENLGSANWSSWFDITADSNAPTWDWSEVDNLDFDVEFDKGASGSNTAFISAVQIRVSYTDSSILAYAELYNMTNLTTVGSSTLSTYSTDFVRLRSDELTTNWDITNDDEYQVRIYTSNNPNTAYIANAKIILDQYDSSGIDKVEVVHQMINSARTQTATSYVVDNFTNTYTPASFSGTNYVRAYIEATMRTTGGTGYVGFYDDTANDFIDNPVSSELSTTSTSYERLRSGNLYDNADWPTTAADMNTVLRATNTQTTSVSNSWMIIQAQVLPPEFSFSIAGVDQGQTNNGVTTSVSTTVTTLPFGDLAVSTPRYAAHQLNITSNEASVGYVGYVTLNSQLQGNYPGNNIDPFIGNSATWASPQAWISPTSTSQNVNTGWIGANITDSDVNGWSGDTTALFGPLEVGTTEIIRSNQGAVNDTEYINYAIEVNMNQPADMYASTITYSIIPTF